VLEPDVVSRLGVPCLAALALLSSEAAAELPPVHIWYRGSDGCPDGNAFVRRLRELGRAAQLAEVGDRVDFMVSVASSTGGSSGRLERQTQAGQMAIREMVAPRCEQVSEGLALSLDLALDPPLASSPPGKLSAENRRQVVLGLAATLATGLAPAALPGIALFGEVAAHAAGPRLRAEARAAYGRSQADADVDVEVGVLAGRLEGCPLAWATGSWTWEPCLGVDLGALWASSSHTLGRSDVGLWASGVALGRARWQLQPQLVLALQVGAALPFVRYELGAEQGPAVFRTQPVGLELALAAAWQLP